MSEMCGYLLGCNATRIMSRIIRIILLIILVILLIILVILLVILVAYHPWISSGITRIVIRINYDN